ncbi:type II toxin-antitoxin system RelE/ParE family toxin [Methylobacterium sp. J-088]|uniref:type II toxin-antitoxin system RelE/ParE family toxin n=1 Tax=Methylobacterium sp. J-088 TaxID=2836664 RepID=UPI00391909E5
MFLRSEAVGDLDSLYDYIAIESPEQAIALIRRIRSRCESLSELFRAGRARDVPGQGCGSSLSSAALSSHMPCARRGSRSCASSTAGETSMHCSVRSEGQNTRELRLDGGVMACRPLPAAEKSRFGSWQAACQALYTALHAFILTEGNGRLAGFRSKCCPGNRVALAGRIQRAPRPAEPRPAMSCPRLQVPVRRLNPPACTDGEDRIRNASPRLRPWRGIGLNQLTRSGPSGARAGTGPRSVVRTFPVFRRPRPRPGGMCNRRARFSGSANRREPSGPDSKS